MADSYTPYLNLTLPEVGASRDTWGTKINSDLTSVDALFKPDGTGTSVGLNVGASKTLSVGGTLSVSGTFTSSVDFTMSGTGQIKVPTGTTAQRSGSPSSGMFRFNSSVNRFEGYNGTAWGSLGGASGAGGDSIFYENGNTVTTSYTISSNTNAMSAGPITVNSGVVVTVPTGSRWVVV
jgi:hypothetical protein